MGQTEEWITIHTNQFAQQLCHDLPDPFGLVLSDFDALLFRREDFQRHFPLVIVCWMDM